MPSLRRDVFLDNIRDEAYINGQFDQLLQAARRKGHAIAIGHPHPETLAVLARRLDDLRRQGVQLISLSRMLRDTGHDPRLLNASIGEVAGP